MYKALGYRISHGYCHTDFIKVLRGDGIEEGELELLLKEVNRKDIHDEVQDEQV